MIDPSTRRSSVLCKHRPVRPVAVLFYPVIPVLAYVNLLWAKPKRNGRGEAASSAKFREAEYFACTAHAISGGIGTPVQLVFQVWMMLNGVMDARLKEFSCITVSDWEGNSVCVPIVSSLTLLFSILSILKATIDLNIIRVHTQSITTLAKGVDFACITIDHLPFLSVAAAFRIASVVLCILYLSSFGLIPVIGFLVALIILGHVTYSRRNLADAIPVWLIAFIGTFVPVCFTTKNIKSQSARDSMIGLQYESFFYQSLVATVLYSASLAAVAAVVSLPYSATNYAYSANVALDNAEFRATAVCMGILAVLNLALSLRPTVSSMFGRKPYGHKKSQSERDKQGCAVTALQKLQTIWVSLT